MSENHPLIITIKENLKSSACHNCGKPFELVKLECQDGNAKGVIYCVACDELSNATFVAK